MLRAERSSVLMLPILCLALLGTSAEVGAEPQAASPFNNLTIFARALAHVEASYVQEIDQDALIYGAIRGMLRELDPHSAFMDPEEYRVLSSDAEGRYGGIGVEIEAKDGWLTVITAYSEGPAGRAGVRPGDRFLSLDGEPARDLPIEDAVRIMRGEPGTKVQVEIRRAAAPDSIRLTLTREVIAIEAVKARLLPDRTLLVRVTSFNAATVADFRRALDQAEDRAAPAGGLRGVLIDLRDNGGGLLDAAVLLADELLEAGVIVSVRGRGGSLLREVKATAGDKRPPWPIVVLVNGYTASAAEIVAAALQENRRALLVGARTFGKGSVQNVIELPDGSAIKLTTARYYTPSGRSIQAEGIEPDVAVEPLQTGSSSESEGAALRESSLARHLDAESRRATPAAVPRGAVRKAEPVEPGRAGLFPEDNQARVGHQILTALIEEKGQ